MEDEKILIRNASQVVTCSGFEAKKGKAMSDVGIIEDGAVAMSDGIITHVGPTEEVLRQVDVGDYLEVDASGRALLPGFVDSHTHFVFGGYREEEFSWRMKGDSYMSIMERGGGIVNTMNATRNASYDDLYGDAYDRLDAMMDMGVTTVEGKSGYGLDLATELIQLEGVERRTPVGCGLYFPRCTCCPAGVCRAYGRICRLHNRRSVALCACRTFGNLLRCLLRTRRFLGRTKRTFVESSPQPAFQTETSCR